MPDNTIKPRNKVKIKITKEITTAFIGKINEEKVVSSKTYEYTFSKDYKSKTDKEKKALAKIIFTSETKSKKLNKTDKHTTKKKITSVLTKDSYKKGDIIQIPLIKRKISFTKLDEAELYDEVYIIVQSKGLETGETIVELRQGDKEELELEGVGIYVQHNNTNVKEIKEKIGNFSKDESIENKDDFKDWSIAKIKLAPKNETKLKIYRKFLKDATDKKANLYLLVKASISGDSFTNTFYNEVHGKIANRWYDGDAEGVEWFGLKEACCGKEFNKKFQCTRYGTVYGPIYWGNLKLENYKFWNDLIKSKKITQEEKEILIVMSENEGKLNSVHSYDSEIFTAGAMQKTVNKNGKGEFPIQVKKFKKSYPDKYKSLFENCGWTVEKDVMYYKDLSISTAIKITGNVLKTKIREGFKSSEFKKKLECKPLEPIVKALNDKDFQEIQVKDFIDRLKNIVLQIKPTGYAYELNFFLKSKLGKATVLDQHINRPKYVDDDFGEALDNFFLKKDKEVDEFNKDKKKKEQKEKISKNPSDWGNQHINYEKEILDDYGKNRRGTDMENRYNKMKLKL